MELPFSCSFFWLSIMSFIHSSSLAFVVHKIQLKCGNNSPYGCKIFLLSFFFDYGNGGDDVIYGKEKIMFDF